MTLSVMLRNLPPALALAISAVLVTGCINLKSGPPLPLAADVDLNRMYGRWYIIAGITKGDLKRVW